MPSLSEQERHDLALTIAGEIDPRLTTYGTAESAQEMAAILGTIENRRALGYFKYGNYSDVVKAKKQYSTWNTEKGRKIAEENYGLFKKHIDRAVDAFAGGYLKSPAPDATHYWAPKAMLALTGSSEPYWAPDIVERKAVGAHIFGEDPKQAERLPRAREWVRVPPIPTIKPSQIEGIPGQYAYAGATRLSAPTEPVSDGRTVAEKQRDRLTMGRGGVLGLDGRQAIERGVPPFERGTWRPGSISSSPVERRASAEPASIGSDVTVASAVIPVPTPKPLAERSPDLMWGGGTRLEPPPPGSSTDFYANFPNIKDRQEFIDWNRNPFLLERSKLAELDPAMQKIVTRARELAGTRFVVGSGRRTAEEQAKAVRRGWSATMNSDHVTSDKAVDLWPVDDKWAVAFDPVRQDMIVSAMKQAADELGYELDVGADWKKRDMPHFSLKRRAGEPSGTEPFAPTPDEVPVPTPRPQRLGGSMPEGGTIRAGLADIPAEPALREAPQGGWQTGTDKATTRRLAETYSPDVVAARIAAARAGHAAAGISALPESGWHRAMLAGMPPAQRSALDQSRRTGMDPAVVSRLAEVYSPDVVAADIAAARARYDAARRKSGSQQASALPPEGAWHRAALAGIKPSSQGALAPVRGLTRPGPTAPVPSRLGIAAMPYAAGARMPAPRSAGALGALERLVANPISLGPGGRTPGPTGLAAMDAVYSGRAPVGAVAFSRSNPDVSVMALPTGNIAFTNSKHGNTTVFSKADEDVLGFHAGKVIAVDPTGTRHVAVTPEEARGLAAKGWAVSNMPGKGFSKAPAPGTAMPGFLSGLFGKPSTAAGKSPGGILSGLLGLAARSPTSIAAATASTQAAPQPGLAGFLSGLFGAALGPGGLGGLSGGAGGLGAGGPAGGMGGLGENYGGL